MYFLETITNVCTDYWAFSLTIEQINLEGRELPVIYMLFTDKKTFNVHIDFL